MNVIDVSIQFPQLHPPPASGDKTMPAPATVLSQHPGRNRFHVLMRPDVTSHSAI